MACSTAASSLAVSGLHGSFQTSPRHRGKKCLLGSCVCSLSPTANRHMLRALAQAGGGAFEFFDTKTKHTWTEKVSRPSLGVALAHPHPPPSHSHASPLAAGGAAGEADGSSRLQLRVGKVAAVQPNGAPSCPSPPAAARCVQRLPHLGLRLRATLHSGA